MDVRTSDLPRRIDSLALPMRAQSLHSGCQSLTPKNAARHGQVHPHPADRHQPTQVPELTTKVLKWGAEIEWPFLAQSSRSVASMREEFLPGEWCVAASFSRRVVRSLTVML